MGHQISKQQNQQMSDESTIKPSTSAKNRRTASSAKKSKKQSAQQSNDQHVHQELYTEPKSLTTTVPNQDRNAGSVVITIRLLKMESARSFGGIDDDTQNDNYSNNNCPTDRSHTQCTDEVKASDILQNSVQVNSDQNQNIRHNVNNNTRNVNECDAAINCWMIENGATTINEFMNCDNGNQNSGQNKRNSIKTQHVNHALRSEASICDKVQTSCTSQQQQQLSNTVNDLTHLLNSINLTDTAQVNASDTPGVQTEAVQTNSGSFIPSNLISSVSPYPHHIPICLNAVVSEHASLCQHPKAGDDDCCNKNSSASKDPKELKVKKPNWGIKLSCTKLKGIKALSSSLSPESPSSSSTTESTTVSDSNSESTESSSSMNTPTAPTQQPTALLLDKSTIFSTSGGNVIVVTMDQQQPWFAPDEYSIEDCDKKARLQRAIEIAEGVEPPPGFISTSNLQSLQTVYDASLQSMSPSNLQLLPGSLSDPSNGTNCTTTTKAPVNASQWTMLCSNSRGLFVLPNILQHADDIPRIHSQVDYIHCLVPDLMQITNCSSYWGKMDRYEAERLLENKPEGTFLLRDSAQEEYLFSVSFRKYGRSLHARIEQFNHKFSFDSHDPNVYTSKTVTGLLEHYKDPACVMFFEPALTLPLNRSFVFSLQQLCRATIVSHTTYDGIDTICLPKKLKSYLKEYHYKQRVRVKRFDESNYSTA